MRRTTEIVDVRIRRNIRVTKRGCWLWMGSRNENGYGHFVRMIERRQRKFYVHRYVYETLVGPIPPGHHVIHTSECGNRACCAPHHLTTIQA